MSGADSAKHAYCNLQGDAEIKKNGVLDGFIRLAKPDQTTPEPVPAPNPQALISRPFPETQPFRCSPQFRLHFPLPLYPHHSFYNKNGFHPPSRRTSALHLLFFIATTTLRKENEMN